MPYVHDEIVVRSSELSLLDEEPVASVSLTREIEKLPHLAGPFRAFSLCLNRRQRRHRSVPTFMEDGATRS